jgi:hypothetical protein
MQDLGFSEADYALIRSLGITEERVRVQLEIFRQSSFQVRLNRPCTLGDGIRELDSGAVREHLHLQEKAAADGRFFSFVPASGAATRMFQVLSERYGPAGAGGAEQISQGEVFGDTAASFRQCIERFEEFAFWEDLEGAMAGDGLNLNTMLRTGRHQKILEYLLTDRGLNYGDLPKGLLPFHRYPSGNRTAFEEHLVEAAHYVRDRNRECRLHFTVSSDYQARFQRLLERVRRVYENRCGIRYDVGFSPQKTSSHTIAVDGDNRPFRDERGRLLFRPAGHGALLENLNELQGDLVYLKNIDNVVPDHLKGETVHWQKLLGGYLVQLQETAHRYLHDLSDGSFQDVAPDMVIFCREQLLCRVPEMFDSWPPAQKREFLIGWLNRPMRVCGMVRNMGEPGGGPFWVKGRDGALSMQIVESAQVDFNSPGQRKIWEAATHFNPVNLVCAVRDYEGKPFDLEDFSDPQAVFITRKSQQGKEFKALELPGLWNGSMSEWITVFVEVPMITFNPVKSIKDLLRTEHQPASHQP